jgi:hypothetical protein
MAVKLLSQVRGALARLNPAEIRESAERRIRVLIDARASTSYATLEDYLAPGSISREKRLEVARTLLRACDSDSGSRFHLIFLENGLPVPEGWFPGKDVFFFDPERPSRLVREVVEGNDDYALPLARLLPPFRQAVARRTIHRVAAENATFSLVTALPNVLPSALEIPWTAGEFASDTAVLTANQIRMAFLLAAASDRAVGFREQRNEIGSIVAGAFGWRACARELSGKIPFGGGLIPKAAIAYAGTYVVGLSLERIYRVGFGLTRIERQEAYEAALAKGKEVATGLLKKVRPET